MLTEQFDNVLILFNYFGQFFCLTLWSLSVFGFLMIVLDSLMFNGFWQIYLSFRRQKRIETDDALIMFLKQVLIESANFIPIVSVEVKSEDLILIILYMIEWRKSRIV